MKKIVAALDLQSHTALIVNKAVEMANRFEAELHLIHVIAPVGSYSVNTNLIDPLAGIEAAVLPNELDLMEVQRSTAEEQLSGIEADLHPRETIVKVLLGIIEDEVVNYAREVGADMIVIGTHQQSGLSRLLNGETSVRILHEAQIPILVIPTVEQK